MGKTASASQRNGAIFPRKEKILEMAGTETPSPELTRGAAAGAAPHWAPPERDRLTCSFVQGVWWGQPTGAGLCVPGSLLGPRALLAGMHTDPLPLFSLGKRCEKTGLSLPLSLHPGPDAGL